MKKEIYRCIIMRNINQLQKAFSVYTGLILLFLLSCPTNVYSQKSDSIKTIKINEVVVKAQMNRTDASSSTFIPNSKQKNSSQNGIDLLRQLAIPQISINLMDHSVKTPSGESVSIYVNYIPASAEELEGMLTSDVRKVEYLDFPTDPRFQGNEHVINFIVQKYEYGGYTKATVNENFLIGRLSSNASVYSRFVYRKMTYDLYAGASNHDIQHFGTSTEGLYSLINSDGQSYQTKRNEIFDNSHFRQNLYPVTFRAIYDTDKIQIVNTIGFNFDQSPTADTKGRLVFDSGQNTDYEYDKNNPSTSRYVIWSGIYYFILPKKFHLRLSPGINYGHTNYSYSYMSTLPGSSEIINNSIENVLQLQGRATLFKQITDKQNAFLSISAGSTSNKVSYFGTAPYDNKFLDTYLSASLGYKIFNKMWNVSADAALQWEKNSINEYSIAEIYPIINLSAGFSPSNKHSLRTYFHFGANYPGASEKTSNTLQQNELMYYTGNPNLGLSRTITFSLSYNWMPVNAFTASAFLQHFTEFNLFVPVYEPYNNGTALIRTYKTDCNYNRTQLGMSFNYKLLGGNLQLAASPSVSFYRMTGRFDISHTPFYCNASATYYHKNFYFQASYQTRSLTLQGNRGAIYEDRDFYQILAGWSHSNLNIRLSAMNLFRNDWLSYTTTVSTPNYSEIQSVEGNNYHQRLSLSITYTIGYGKKVRRGNEVGKQYGAASAIMK